MLDGAVLGGKDGVPEGSTEGFDDGEKLPQILEGAFLTVLEEGIGAGVVAGVAGIEGFVIPQQVVVARAGGGVLGGGREAVGRVYDHGKC